MLSADFCCAWPHSCWSIIVHPQWQGTLGVKAKKIKRHKQFRTETPQNTTKHLSHSKRTGFCYQHRVRDICDLFRGFMGFEYWGECQIHVNFHLSFMHSLCLWRSTWPRCKTNGRCQTVSVPLQSKGALSRPKSPNGWIQMEPKADTTATPLPTAFTSCSEVSLFAITRVSSDPSSHLSPYPILFSLCWYAIKCCTFLVYPLFPLWSSLSLLLTPLTCLGHLACFGFFSWP